MSVWDLRQFLESKVPWWAPFALGSTLYVLIYFYAKWNAKKQVKKMNERLRRKVGE